MMEKNNNIKSYIIPIILSFLALVLLVIYIFRTSVDVIYSDYIRFTNSYIENVFDLSKMLTADILTRIPISYFFRMVNVGLFSYSLMFDRVLTVFFLACIFVIVAKYLVENNSKLIFLIFLFVICFGLNQWELILNGSGYSHYLAYVLFIYYFYSVSKEAETISYEKKIDNLECNNISNKILKCYNCEKRDVLNNFISAFTIIFVAGPYCATFVVTAILLNIFLKKYKNLFFIIVPFLLYLASNHFAVYEHSGLQNIGLIECISNDIFYPIRFLLKAIASSLLGIESYEALISKPNVNPSFIYIISFVLVIIYLIVFIKLVVLVFKEKGKRGLFELSLLVMCIGNYLLVFLGRYGFMNDSYGMQSRYYLQYMIGNIAVICFVSRYCFDNIGIKEIEKKDYRLNINAKKTIFVSVLMLVFVFPIIFTSKDEIHKISARRAAYEHMLEVAYNIDKEKDEILPQTFEYNHDPQLIRDAFNIIKRKGLNIYKK